MVSICGIHLFGSRKTVAPSKVVASEKKPVPQAPTPPSTAVVKFAAPPNAPTESESQSAARPTTTAPATAHIATVAPDISTTVTSSHQQNGPSGGGGGAVTGSGGGGGGGGNDGGDGGGGGGD